MWSTFEVFSFLIIVNLFNYYSKIHIAIKLPQILSYFKHTYPIVLSTFWSSTRSLLTWISLELCIVVALMSWTDSTFTSHDHFELEKETEVSSAGSSERRGWRHTIKVLRACLPTKWCSAVVLTEFSFLPDFIKALTKETFQNCFRKWWKQNVQRWQSGEE